MSVACDVGEPDSVANMVAAAVDRFGRVDILVNNAGVVADAGPAREKLPHDAFEQTIKVNLLGTWYCCRDVGAHMLADGKGGSIINIASVAGMGGAYEIPPAYQASKAAVINLTRNLAVAWADRGVRVNAIAPGWFWSEMTEAAFNNPIWHARATGGTPMNKIGDPEELSGVLLLLASGAGSYLTGQTIAVDGGLSASFGAAPPSPDLTDLIGKGVPDGLAEPIGPT
jgi:gluconate 5-dehydrogenase